METDSEIKGEAFCLLSAEHPTLPLAEIRALAEIYGRNVRIRRAFGNVIVVVGLVDVSKFVERASYVRFGGELLEEVEYPRVEEQLGNLDFAKNLAGYNSFAVRVIDSRDSQAKSLESSIGRTIKDQLPSIKVSLEQPDVIVSLLKSSDSALVGLMHPWTLDKAWRSRRPRARPFFHPSALYPKFARALVNLALLREGEIIFDPFCGTGTILMEATIMGISCVGADIAKKMCYGTRKNLVEAGPEFLGVVNSDSTKTCITRCDAIVTDVPYGRTSSRKGRSLQDIVSSLSSSAREVLLHGRRLVLVCPKGTDENGHEGFELVEKHYVYVHRNLTREIRVLKRK